MNPAWFARPSSRFMMRPVPELPAFVIFDRHCLQCQAGRRVLHESCKGFQDCAIDIGRRFRGLLVFSIDTAITIWRLLKQLSIDCGIEDIFCELPWSTVLAISPKCRHEPSIATEKRRTFLDTDIKRRLAFSMDLKTFAGVVWLAFPGTWPNRLH